MIVIVIVMIIILLTLPIVFWGCRLRVWAV